MFGDSPLPFFAHSYLFVDFFFVLSGFVITHTYQQRIQSGMPLREYTLLRLARLYPLHLITLLAWLPFLGGKFWLYSQGFWDTSPFEVNSASTFISNLLLVHAYGIHDHPSWNLPSWSISCEMAAYLIFFLLLKTLDRHRGYTLPLCISAVSYGILFSVNNKGLDLTFDYGMLRCLGAFYLGVLAYRLKQNHPSRFDDLVVLQWPLMLSLPVLVTFAETSDLTLLCTLLTFPLLVLAFSSQRRSTLGRTLETRPLMAIGQWSYSIYMTHALLVFLLSNAVGFGLKLNLDEGIGWLSPAANVIYLALVLLTSFVTYTYVERPAQKWLGQHIKRSNTNNSSSRRTSNSSI